MKTVCIVFGGQNSEHEVSLRSATSVLEQIDRAKYQVEMLGITKDGRWLRYQGAVEHIADGSWERRGPVCPAIISPDRSHRGMVALDAQGARVIPLDVVFPVLHGKYGEDGTVQGLFDLAGIPYVGSGVLGSAVCMDKEVSHQLLVAAGVPKTALLGVLPEEMEEYGELQNRLEQALGYPMFVKPANAGSSVGVSKVKDAGGLRTALELAFAHDGKAVVEKEIVGREVECSVIGNLRPEAAAVVGEIAPEHEFYDYEGKYLDDSTQLHIPAHIDEAAAAQVRQLAVRAYRALGCRGFARVDFFVQGDGSAVLNELNTLPGFTSISMYPKLWEASGLPYARLIDRLIDCALQP